MQKKMPGAKDSFLLLPLSIMPNCLNRQWHDCATLWHRRGNQSSVAATPGAMQTDYIRSGMRHFPLPSGNTILSRWRRNRQIAELVRTRQPQRIWVQDIADLTALRRAMPSLTGVRAFISTPPAADVQLRKTLQDLLFLGGQIVTDSAFGEAALNQNFGIDPTQIMVLPPAIDSNVFNPGHVTAERALRLAERWRVPEGSAMILHIGALMPGGGQTALLEALAKLGRKDVYVVFLGEEVGPGYSQQLLSMVEHNHLLGQVLFVEHCPDLAAALWFAHAITAVNSVPCGALPEILAAQAMGRPVIVTNVGAHPELVAPGETAWVIPAENSDYLKETLGEVLALSMQDRLRLAMRMQEFVSTHFAYGPWLETMLSEDTGTVVAAEAA
jgi:glycosyltransferase involved in cell wall biosynthesis